jgi:cyanophycinase
MRWIPASLLALVLAACGHAGPTPKPAARYQLRQADGPGPFFLVGGGDDSPALLGRFLALAGGKDAPIAIVPFAGGEVQGERYTALFRDRGATNLAVVTGAAGDHALVRGAAGLWFAGGSPDKLLAAFRPFADDARAAWQAGAAVGGHSAGSMIWGTDVIVKGESPDAVAKGPAALEVDPGLALMPATIVDPHFSARARFTRLWLACKERQALGIGIDEETAAYMPAKGPLEAFGVGAVTVIKPEGAAARVAVVPAGQALDLASF